MTQLSRTRRSSTRAAVNGPGCCLADCANPFDLAIIPVNLSFDVNENATAEINIRTEAYTGQIVGIRVLNSPGEFDIVQMSSPASRAGALYIGSGEVVISGGGSITDQGDFVDASIFQTDNCMCPIDLGCANTNTGPKILVKRSDLMQDNIASKQAGASDHPLLDSQGAAGYLRMNLYICYDAAQLADPSRLCPTGASGSASGSAIAPNFVAG